MPSIKERVIDIIVDQLNVTKEECSPEADLIDDLGANISDIIELVLEIEEIFDIE
jgi:acyl carrier protein